MKRLFFAFVLMLAQPTAQRIPHAPPAARSEVEQLRSEVEELRNRIFDAEVRIHKLENPEYGVEPAMNRKRLEQVRWSRE